jgi:glycerol-3-phosphate acyltransferase PlsX
VSLSPPSASGLPRLRLLRQAPSDGPWPLILRRGGAVATVAVDTLGADLGAAEMAAGAAAAARSGIGCIVFGPRSEIEPTLVDAPDGTIEIVDAPVSISNDEEPARTVRARPDASVVQAARAVAEGRADAMLSAGSTGAALAASLVQIRRLPGVYRPAIAVPLPLPAGLVLLLDVGANVEVRPEHLVQFAYMGAAFSEKVLRVERPRVGLLSVGQEPGKGTPNVVAAHEQLVQSNLSFIGNVEGDGLASGEPDVVVTDGFTGNVALKLMEGTSRSIADAIRQAARSGALSALGGLLMKPKLSALRDRLDPERVGGAYLLGLRRLVIVCHGRSTRRAIENAIGLAARGVEQRVVERTAEALAASSVVRGAAESGEADLAVSADTVKIQR